MRLYRYGLGFLLLAMLAAACTTQPVEPVQFTVEMSEYAYSPAEIEVEVGQEVTLDLVNTGALAHEVMIGRDMAQTDGHPGGYAVDFFETAGIEPHVTGGMGGMDAHDSEHSDHSGAFMVSLPAGPETASITFKVTKAMVGEWEIGCFEQEGVHYAAGMVGTLIVKP